jgi:predicted RNase H-like HicB family nuclease
MRTFWNKLRRFFYNWRFGHTTAWEHSYAIVIRRLQPEEGGGFMACIPQLGWLSLTGDGETPEEALHNLQDASRHFGQDLERICRERQEKCFPGVPWIPYDEDGIGAVMSREPRLMNQYQEAAAERYRSTRPFNPQTFLDRALHNLGENVARGKTYEDDQHDV